VAIARNRVSKETASGIVSAEELDAAIAAIESLSPGEGGIPNLDDGKRAKVVRVPVPVPAPSVSRPRPAELRPAPAEASVPSDSSEPAPQGAAGEAKPTRPAGILGRLRAWFVLRRHRKDATVHGDEAAQPDAPAPPLLYRVAEGILTAINRPFAGLSPRVRQTIGLIGLITVLIAAVSAALLPRLVNRDDAVSFLAERRAQLLAAPSPRDRAGSPSPAPAARGH